ncbi:class I SAM-dependent methyltransferase [Oceanirhabdus sp. W0125-5]|uniref:class I SAM-dependent methyltransferase n=1 Tax=Oceanirhabdus sp. W0125-5 TaxID=2999116 RepID=UPI0022F2DA39|nr:class I SAM-dependent methyltransferase [Oceanirhabdus sp. W0125-5]WBW96809.1 class I SAM-dependent methyltransferase [Oceanirhabdus sp. W0125-5]
MNDRDFFNSVAAKWDEMCTHDENKIKEILELSEIHIGAKILDIATGTGVLVKYLLNKSPKIIKAVDISENMIEVAKEKYDDTRVEFIVSDVMEYNENEFDYVFIYSAYPHFKDKQKLFDHIFNLMNENGKLVIAHSDSKEKINAIHSNTESVKEHKLAPVKETAELMSNYFKVDIMVDNNEMYYISGIKKSF